MEGERIMNFTLNDEQVMLIDTIRKMGEREKLREQAKHIDATGEFPEYLVAKFAEMGLLGVFGHGMGRRRPASLERHPSD